MPASQRGLRVLLTILLCCGLGGVRAALAADDTARFYGTWKISFPYNGQTVTIISVHDQNGYKNYLVTPTGNQPFGDGTFSAANGRWRSSAPAPNDGGTYKFTSNNEAVCTNSAGQTVTWRRAKAFQPSPTPGPGPGTNPTPSPEPAPASPRRQKAEFKDDPTVSPQINAAFRAINQKDYNTAWRTFMAAAQS